MARTHIRLSQFITTFGPGSILEGENGPVLVRSPDLALIDLINSGIFNPYENEIMDPSLRKRLKARLLHLPSNTSLDIPETRSIYTNPYYFPKWALCSTHNILYRYNLRNDTQFPCTKCNKELRTNDARWRKYRKDAIRFIMVCEKGHINEVPWKYIAHNGKTKIMEVCDQKTFRWYSAPKMNQIQVKCNKCKTIGSLGIIGSFKKCSGRYFFKEYEQTAETCDEAPKITLRGSTSVYIPNIISAVTIPPLDDEPTRIFFKKGLDIIFEREFKRGKPFDAIVELINEYSMSDYRVRHKRLLLNLFKRGEEEIKNLLLRKKEIIIVDDEGTSLNEIDWNLRDNELQGILQAIQTGVAPQYEDGKLVKDFIIDKSKIKIFDFGSFKFRVTPIERLRVVMVLHSFCRLKPHHYVDLKFSFESDPDTKWILGMENYGEGVFIDIIEKDTSESMYISKLIAKPRQNAWNEVITHAPDQFVRFPHFDINRFIQFLWYHSLSHRIVRSLSIATGYSTASIREKIYSQRVHGRLLGGVLLYTSGAGSDGSLGGLSASVDQFGEILIKSLWDVDDCSNDPLCVEQQISIKRPIGAACYSCMFVPETTCEFQNKFLDRRLTF